MTGLIAISRAVLKRKLMSMGKTLECTDQVKGLDFWLNLSEMLKKLKEHFIVLELHYPVKSDISLL